MLNKATSNKITKIINRLNKIFDVQPRIKKLVKTLKTKTNDENKIIKTIIAKELKKLFTAELFTGKA